MLATRDLTVSVGGKRVCVGLDFTLGAGERWALLGRNGAGKTTLLHVLAGLRRPDQGQVLLQGEPIRALSRRAVARTLGLLPQDSDDPLPASVLETALIGRHPHLSPWAWESGEDRELAHAALAKVELETLARREVATLSGGERRRLAVATLLTQAPALYLLDEPTNHLDLHHQVRILELLCAETERQHGAMLLSLHDLNLARRFCTHALLLLGDGETLAGPVEELFTPAWLERLYGHPVRVVEAADGPVYVPG